MGLGGGAEGRTLKSIDPVYIIYTGCFTKKEITQLKSDINSLLK